MSSDCPDEIELHKPYIDAVHLDCPKCGAKMTRVCRRSSTAGTIPVPCRLHNGITLFENQEEFKVRFPADFISEAVDQTRGWFYTLLAISTAVFETNCFNNCIVLGHVPG